MKNRFHLYLLLLAISSCNSKTTNTEVREEKTESTIESVDQNEQIGHPQIVNGESSQLAINRASNCSHPEYFEFDNYEEYCINDTIKLDLNGNGKIERIYFNNTHCPKIIIEEKDQDLISIGCGKENYEGFPNALGWVNLWCIVSDKETLEILVEDGELVGERIIELERPSIYIGKEEAGGGIITYRNGNLYWIHQSD